MNADKSDTPNKSAQIATAAAEALWRANQSAARDLAEAVFKAHQLRPAEIALVGNLEALLVDLQKGSFFHGAIAVMAVINPELGADLIETKPVVQ